MTIWVMLLGMVTLINLTMVGALVSLVGNIPDGSFLVILSRYLKKRDEPLGVLSPLEAASRLERFRRRVLQIAAAVAAMGVALTLWALTQGWGAIAMSAITAWITAANLAFYHIPLALWKRRAGRMREEVVEEAWRKYRHAPPEPEAGESSEGTTSGESTQDSSVEG
ncbi:MAG: hypothetical protein JW854_02965 [Actinobacteria bacterium]|nr:hypothetical protein [Actinomycetota bacterium]